MNGNTHALSATAAFLGLAVPLSQSVPLTSATVALGAIVAGGAGLLPDLDHRHATAARTFGPITWALARAVEAISGGHRHATHSLIGAGVFTGIAAWATHAGGWPLTILLALCIGLADRALLPRAKPRKDWKLTWGDVAGLVHAAAAGVVGYLLAHSTLDMTVVPYAVAIGVAAHIAGDALTERGVPICWPHLRFYRLATIDTGKWVETWVVVPALYAALAVIAYTTRGTWMPWIPTFYTLTGG